MKKLTWCFVLDANGLRDIFTVNGQPLPHPTIHTVVATHLSNPELGSTCDKKLFHSKTDIIYPLELEKMVECYNNGGTPIQDHVVNHGFDVFNNGSQIINT